MPNSHSTQPQRTAIVTGAARGIGAAVARRMASDGLAVAVVDLDEKQCSETVESIRDAGGQAIAIGCDVAEESAVDAAVARVCQELSPPTVLVSNAGIGPYAPFEELTVDQWDRVLGVNLRGAFLFCRAVREHMVSAGFGRIVTVSSISAVGEASRADYASSKAGLLGFTKSLALQLGRHGITANAIAPGFIVSEMTRTTGRRLGRDFEEHQRIAADRIPVGRVGQPEDIAHTASYLVHPDAGFVSGQVIFVAGGPID